jgi:hypothetical protein
VKPAREPHTPEPDLEIAAEATAREARFCTPPDIEVHAGEIVSVRDNLPAPVHAGVTYRSVRAAMSAARRLRAAADPKPPRTGR